MGSWARLAAAEPQGRVRVGEEVQDVEGVKGKPLCRVCLGPSTPPAPRGSMYNYYQTPLCWPSPARLLPNHLA